MSSEYHYEFNSGSGSGNASASAEKPAASTGSDDTKGWILIAVFFATGLWPIGLFLLISKLSDGSGKRAKEKARAAMQTAKKETVSTRPVKTKKLTRTSCYSAKGARVMRIAGLIWAMASLMLAAMNVTGDGSALYNIWDFISAMAIPFSGFLGGMGLVAAGRSMQLRARRFGKYLACAGEAEAIDINDLARAAAVSEPKAEKDCEIMAEKGLWGADAYVDNGRDMVFRSRAAAAAYFAAQHAAAIPGQSEEGYSGALRNIRRANDRIADPILSEKIDRLEQLAGKILKLVESDPKKQQKASTFLNYYLPTTQKLLDSYADFEETGVSGENLSEAKNRIAATVDSIIQGFEHQLDDLYQAEVMDIEGEVRVMETMLHRDAANAAKDFGLDGGTAVQSADMDSE